MPHKFNASRRHRIPKAKYKVLNWSAYDRGLVQRGDIRFWIAEEILEAWVAPLRKTPGGQRRYSEVAIWATLMLGQVFGQPLRQTEGFVRSILALMGCDLPVPDHSTLARRRRSVEVPLETSTNRRPTDIALDSTGPKFFGAPLGIILCMTLRAVGRMGTSKARRNPQVLEKAPHFGGPGDQRSKGTCADR